MKPEEIRSEIKNFIVLSSQDDHEATNDSLKKILDAKVKERYDAAMADVVGDE